MHRPAVAAICLNIKTSRFLALAILLQQLRNVRIFLCRTQSTDNFGENGTCCRSRGRILLTKQFLCFGRPRHEFTIQAYPIRFQFLPNSRVFHGLSNSLKKFRFERGIVKEAPSCARVAHSFLSFHNAEPFLGSIGIATDYDHRTRSHMFLLTNYLVHTLVKVICECLLGALDRKSTRLNSSHIPL